MTRFARLIAALALLLLAPLGQADALRINVTKAIAFNCTTTACDLKMDTYAVQQLSCIVKNGSDAARGVTWSVLDGDGTTVLLASASVSVTAAASQAFTMSAQATTAVSNFNVTPVQPGAITKITVAAAGTTGNATVSCWGR